MRKPRKGSTHSGDNPQLPNFWRRQSHTSDDSGGGGGARRPKRRAVVTNPKDPIKPLYWQFEFESLGFFFVVFSPVDRETIAAQLGAKNLKMKHSETFPITREPQPTASTFSLEPRLRSMSRGPRAKRQLQTRSWHEAQRLTLSPANSPKLTAKVGRCASTNEGGSESPSGMFKFSRSRMQKSATSDHISMNSSFTNETESMYKSLGNIDEDKVFDGSGTNLSVVGKSPALQRPPSARFLLMHLLKLDRFVNFDF